MQKNKINKIFKQDCILGMKSIPDEACDLIIADPPYNLDKDFGEYKESENKEIWLEWSKTWINECKRVLSPKGSIFIYGIHHHLCWLQCHMIDIGLAYRRQIIWHYENGFSGYKNTLQAHYEPLLWFSKTNDYFYKIIREPYKSKERLKNKIYKNGKEWTPHPDGRMVGDVWKFPTLAGRRFKEEKVNHPTQKPLSISDRIDCHFSEEGDLILVPFAGSGTECLSAHNNKRNFIGFELNQEYIDIANKRLRK